MFHFESVLIFALLLLPLLLLLLHWRSGALLARLRERFASSAMFARLAPAFAPQRKTQKVLLTTVALVLLIVALANPRMGYKKESSRQKSADIYIALDVSKSMLATDAQPNRLEAARLFAQQLLQQFSTDRVGLILFAGEATVRTPLTTDHASLQLQIRSASSDDFMQQGTAVESCIDLVERSYGGDASGQVLPPSLIVLTDGENHEARAVERAKIALDKGIHTHVVSFGTEAGARINLADGSGFLRDAAGAEVISRMDANQMRAIAQAGGGVWVDALAKGSTGASQEILQALRNVVRKEGEEANFDSFDTYFFVPALLAFLLLFAEWCLPFAARSKEAKTAA